MPNRVRFVDPGIIVQSGGGSGGGTSISSSYALSASYADYAVSASHEIVKEVSSSYADTASYAVTASYALNAGTGGGDSDWYNGGTFITSSVPIQVTGSVNVKSGHVNLGSNSYFFQGSNTSNGNVSLIGVNSSDQIYIGNQGYTNIIADDTNIEGDTQITGSIVNTDSLTTKGYVYVVHGTTLQSGTTAALYLGTSNAGMDIARYNDNTLVLGGVTQNYGWRIFGIKHGLNSSIYTTEIDNLIATGSMRVSGSLDISLPSGSAFTIRENDKPENIDDRLEFEFSNGDPTLRIISQGTGVSTIRLQNEESAPTTGVTINQSGQFRLDDDNGFTIANPSATEFNLSPIVGSPASNTNNLGNNTRPWSNLYVYNGIGYSTGGGAGSFNSKRVNIQGENRNTGIFNYGNMSLQYSGSGASTLANPLNHFFGIRLSSDYTPTSIRERLIFSVGKSGSLGINLNQGKTGMPNPSGPNFTFYTASAMVHVEAEPNYSLNLFQGNDVNGNNVFEVDRDGNLTVDAQISASGDLYARDGRFSRDGGTAEIEIIASEAAGGIVGTQTNDNLILRRFNIPKLTISESRNFSHNPLDVQGQVSASTFIGDGSQLTGIETDPFPYTGSAIISGSLGITGSLSIAEGTAQTGTSNFFAAELSGSDTIQRIGSTATGLEFHSDTQNTIISSNQTASLSGYETTVGALLGTNVTRSINLGVNNTLPVFNNLWNIYLGGGQSDTKLFIGSSTTELSGSLSISGSLLNTGTVTLNNGTHTLTGTQQFVLIDPSGGNVTINMPDAATYPGRQIFFKLTQAAGANTVTLQRQGSDTIDGATTYTDLDVQYESISVVSNGSNGWFIF